MAEITPRLMWNNFTQLSGTIITPISSESTMPWSIGLRDQLPSNRGRSGLGWSVATGYNDKLDFSEGSAGDVTATLDAGVYETGDEMATEIQTQMNAVAQDNTYTVTYSSSTNKFTIARATGADTIDLEWDTGTNSATSCGADIGADVDHDDTGATSYTMPFARLMSRFYIKFDLLSALGIKAAALYEHNFTSNAVIKLQGNASDAWGSPTYDQTLTHNETQIIHFPSSEQQLRYWRVYVEDYENDDAFIEMSVVYLGSYTQPSRSYQQRFREPRQELSGVAVADHGAHYFTEKPTRSGFSGTFLRLSETDRTALEAWLDYVKQGRNFFFALDPQNYANDRTFYGSIAQTVFAHAGGGTVLRWNLPVNFTKALG